MACPTDGRPTDRADGKKISGAQKENEEKAEGKEREEEKVTTKSVIAADYEAVEREEGGEVVVSFRG